tara:strand:+ start:46 stop:993 length:948 start_codon:yes stop_codon:yes gene_type:complete
MTRQNIGIGSAANDGNGDTLRQAGTKINANFAEVYALLGGGDSSNLSTQITLENDAVTFEGTSDNDFETRLKVTNPTQDNIITLPDSTGTVTLDNTIQTLTNKTLTSPTIAEIKNTGTLTLPTSTDTILGRATTDTLTNKTLSSPLINNPKIGTQISDSTGNELIKFVKTASAVNEITITNNSNTNNPSIAATGNGADTNVNLSLVAQGKGSVAIGKAAFTSSTITGDGEADSSSSLIICNSGSALAVGLGPGTTIGEFKIFSNKGAGLATITPAPFANGNTIRLPQNTATQCIWDGTNWFMLSGNDSANSILIT